VTRAYYFANDFRIGADAGKKLDKPTRGLARELARPIANQLPIQRAERRGALRKLSEERGVKARNC